MAPTKKTETATVEFDPEDLTAGDMAFVEEYSGKSLTDFAAGTPSVKALIAIAFTLRRKDDSTLKIEDVEQMKLSALMDALGNTEAP